MIAKTATSPEHQKLEEVASDYETRGYTVLRAESEWPDFLSGLHPDVVAVSPNDKVVVRVKAHRYPTADRNASTLAGAVREQSDWRFILITFDSPETEPVSISEAHSIFEQAFELNQQGRHEAALLVGWAATEAVLRNLLALDDAAERHSNLTTPGQIVTTAYSLGLVGLVALDVMLGAAAIRNVIAHGLRYNGPGSIQTAATSLLQTLADVFAEIDAGEPDYGAGRSADEMVRWFHDTYETPADRVPREGGEGDRIYYLGGPYDPGVILSGEFVDADPRQIEEAIRRIRAAGREWIRRGQY